VFVAYAPHSKEMYGTFPATAQAAVVGAVKAAHEAQKAWKRLSRVGRAEYFDSLVRVMRNRKDDIVNAISLETGKNLNESFAEYNEAVHMAQYTFGQGREAYRNRVVASEIAEKDMTVFRKPKGVVGCHCPVELPICHRWVLDFGTGPPRRQHGCLQAV
jgi:acyl-CoA reductase-like NAD-dependent aldehyde dehydrogenase